MWRDLICHVISSIFKISFSPLVKWSRILFSNRVPRPIQSPKVKKLTDCERIKMHEIHAETSWYSRLDHGRETRCRITFLLTTRNLKLVAFEPVRMYTFFEIINSWHARLLHLGKAQFNQYSRNRSFPRWVAIRCLLDHYMSINFLLPLLMKHQCTTWPKVSAAVTTSRWISQSIDSKKPHDKVS